MSAAVPLLIHPSQFPEAIGKDILKSLRAEKINHKLHYLSYKQTARWLKLHQAYSPARADADCIKTYDRAFGQACRRIDERELSVIGLGCGGGQKDTSLLAILERGGKKASYTPVDVSLPLVVTAHRAAAQVISGDRVTAGLICDLDATDDLNTVLASIAPRRGCRILTFFGMVPNFEPALILPHLGALVQPGDYLFVSANLAPGKNYSRGVEQVLPQYANDLTDAWLLTFLSDLGLEESAGKIQWSIERTREGLLRVRANFRFSRKVAVAYEGHRFAFRRGQHLRLFYSYRYTPQLLRKMLAAQGLSIEQEWITASEEEGVFLCRAIRR